MIIFAGLYPFQAFSGLYEDRKGNRKLRYYVKNKSAGRQIFIISISSLY
jgi:hypothetical protein